MPLQSFEAAPQRWLELVGEFGSGMLRDPRTNLGDRGPLTEFFEVIVLLLVPTALTGVGIVEYLWLEIASPLALLFEAIDA